MTSTNDITGDTIKTKSNSNEYVSNWEKIFGKVLVNAFINSDGTTAKVYRKGDSFLVEWHKNEIPFNTFQDAVDYAEGLVL